jgi:hypothetical protein
MAIGGLSWLGSTASRGDVAGRHPGQMRQARQRLDIARPLGQGRAIVGQGGVDPTQALQRPRSHQTGLRRVVALGDGPVRRAFGLGIEFGVAEIGREVVLGRAAGRSGLGWR